MQTCAKLLLIKAGSAIIADDETGTPTLFKLLQDLEVKITCEDFYKVEKQGIISQGELDE